MWGHFYSDANVKPKLVKWIKMSSFVMNELRFSLSVGSLLSVCAMMSNAAGCFYHSHSHTFFFSVSSLARKCGEQKNRTKLFVRTEIA